MQSVMQLPSCIGASEPRGMELCRWEDGVGCRSLSQDLLKSHPMDLACLLHSGGFHLKEGKEAILPSSQQYQADSMNEINILVCSPRIKCHWVSKKAITSKAE